METSSIHPRMSKRFKYALFSERGYDRVSRYINSEVSECPKRDTWPECQGNYGSPVSRWLGDFCLSNSPGYLDAPMRAAHRYCDWPEKWSSHRQEVVPKLFRPIWLIEEWETQHSAEHPEEERAIWICGLQESTVCSIYCIGFPCFRPFFFYSHNERINQTIIQVISILNIGTMFCSKFNTF